MIGNPFMIRRKPLRILVPDGDPEGVRIVDQINWTGLGIVERPTVCRNASDYHE